MKRSTIIATGATVLALSLVGGGIAWSKQDSESRANRMVERITKKLDLNDNQVAALTQAREQMKQTGVSLRGVLGLEPQAIASLIETETFDRAAALDLITQRTQAINDAAPGMVAVVGDFLDTLSAEQKSQLSERMQHRGKRGKHRHHGDRKDDR